MITGTGSNLVKATTSEPPRPRPPQLLPQTPLPPPPFAKAGDKRKTFFYV
jgi:hypothetical protein